MVCAYDTGGSHVNNAAGDPLIGRTVAQYEVVARLGGGGMGVVYAARDTKLGRRVALKFLPPQWSHDEAARERFIREAQAASSTDHRNICTIHDIGSGDEGQLFIVMAHYDGETLKERLEQGPLAVDEAVELAAQVAEGLAKAHAQGVVHRDIKPGNLMLTEDGVKILDFGLAKFAEARFKLTLEGSTIGTIAYMSPEQTRGEDADVRSDVWAIGVVLYEMLTGTPPFKGGYPEAIAHAIKSETPTPLRDASRDTPEALEQLVFRALSKNAAVRFQTARDLARALRLLQGRTIPLDLRTEPVPAAGVHQARPARRPWWKTRKAAAAAAIMALGLVGTPLWILMPAERIPVAVAPVVNQTGYAELDPYRLALTQELIAALDDSRVIRVLPYERLLQIVRRFRAGGGDVSSRESLQAIAMHAGVRTIVVPTLLYENGGWRARVEFRDAAAAINDATVETTPVVSSLMKDAVHGLIATLGTDVGAHFERSGARRQRLAALIRRATGLAPASELRTRSLDAAEAFARGIDFYEQQEHAAAARAFAEAETLDPRNALLHAWHSHAARIMRLDEEAADAAARAARLAPAGAANAARLFIAAVVADAAGDADAGARYADLAAAFPDEMSWTLELAAFQDRTAVTGAATTTAINTYLGALSRDPRLPRADLELCRLYGPTRQNERVNARARGLPGARPPQR